MVSLASIRRLGNVLGGFRKFGQSQANRLVANSSHNESQGRVQTVYRLVAGFAETLESFSDKILKIIQCYIIH